MKRWSFVLCRFMTVGLSLYLFATACVLPAVQEANVWLGEPGYTTGLGALLLGFAEAPIPWSANLFWFAAALMLLAGLNRPAAMSASLSVAVGCSTLAFYRRSDLLEAYQWWMASMAVLGVGSIAAFVISGNRRLHEALPEPPKN